MTAMASRKEVKRSVDQAKNREFLLAQLTIGRWYVDRALDSRADRRRRYLSFARETCELIEHLLPTLTLDAQGRRVTHRDLAMLRARLDQVAETPEPERVRQSE
jgi:hypothetical protein